MLDLCAGNGGKTLALAAMVGPRGRVLAYDVQQSRLQQLDKAAERARVAARVESLPELDEARLQGACDVVLVDAPCSSSGVLRRHPGSLT